MCLYLTESGQKLNEYVEEQSDRKVIELLDPLDKQDFETLVAAMVTVEKILYKVVPNELEIDEEEQE